LTFPFYVENREDLNPWPMIAPSTVMQHALSTQLIVKFYHPIIIWSAKTFSNKVTN